jgi:hypothetical protein
MSEPDSKPSNVQVYVPIADPTGPGGMMDRHADVDYGGRREYVLKSDYDQFCEVIARCYMRLQCADVPREPWHWEVCTTLDNTGIPSLHVETCVLKGLKSSGLTPHLPTCSLTYTFESVDDAIEARKLIDARFGLDQCVRVTEETDCRTPKRDAPLSKDAIRGILMSRGFKIPEGAEDLKPYVYDAVNEVLKAHGIAVNGT